MVRHQDFVYSIPDEIESVYAGPLQCAGVRLCLFLLELLLRWLSLGANLLFVRLPFMKLLMSRVQSLGIGLGSWG